MITSDLISYIKKQLENNTSKELIVSRLVGAGWKIEDVHEGFLNVGSYHEPVGGDSIFEVKKSVYVESPDKVMEEPKILEIPKIEMKKEEVIRIEIPKIEVKKEEPVKIEVSKIELPKTETQKVWTPISIPIKERKITKDLNFDIKKENIQTIDVQNIEIEGKKNDPVRIIPPVNTANVDIPQKAKENNFKDLSKIAMISSYQSDVSALTKKKEEVVKKKNKFSFKWLILLVIILAIVFTVWVFVSGKINIKNINIPFIKKDPKVLLLKSSEVLASLKSYKTETNIEISSPTFVNLLSGKVVDKYISSTEKDSFSVNTLGIIDKNGQKPLSDNFITVKSSLFPDYINIDIKSNGEDLFVSVPDLSKATGRFAPDPAIVKINKEQLSLIPGLFSKNEEERLKRINLYKIMLSGISSYINNENLNKYNEIVNNINVTEKEVGNVKGIDTYHYTITIDNKLSKDLLAKIASNFVSNLSIEDNEKLNQMLTMTTLNSFDVWVGKEDNNIYQYSVALDIPVSTILEPGDKNIGDSKVSISWMTTYYDFDIQNNLFMPPQFVEASEFIKNSKKVQLKNGVSDLKELADNLFVKEKSYGVKSNTNGSCMSPAVGSLFSQTGHTIDGVKEVNDISDLLKGILEKTNGNGFCYSTTKDWSFTVPIVDNYATEAFPEGGYKTFFCADSTGAKENLTSSPKGSVCLPKTINTTTPTAPVKQ